MGRGGASTTATEPLPTLTPAEQTEVDGFMRAGRNAALACMQRLQNDKSMNEPLALKYLKHLVSQGADVNAKASNDADATPLHLATKSGNAKITEFLVLNGADVNAKTIGGDTPLHTAVQWREGDVEIVKFLVSKGADVNANVLLRFSEVGLDVEVVKFLISKGADVNAKNSHDGRTLLDSAKAYYNKSRGNLDSERLNMLTTLIAYLESIGA